MGQQFKWETILLFANHVWCCCCSTKKVSTGHRFQSLEFLTVQICTSFTCGDIAWTIQWMLCCGIWLRVGGGTPLNWRLFCPHPPHPLQNNNLVQLQILAHILLCASVFRTTFGTICSSCCAFLDNSTRRVQTILLSLMRIFPRVLVGRYWIAFFSLLGRAFDYESNVFFNLKVMHFTWMEQINLWLMSSLVNRHWIYQSPCHRWKKSWSADLFISSDAAFMDSFSQLIFCCQGFIGSVWHFPCHPWFSLAFIPFGSTAYTRGGGTWVGSSHKFWNNIYLPFVFPLLN